VLIRAQGGFLLLFIEHQPNTVDTKQAKTSAAFAVDYALLSGITVL
jgi:hypothetical protein